MAAYIRGVIGKYHYVVGISGVLGLGAYILRQSSKHSNDTGFHILDNDPTLRNVEKDVLIPKYIRDYSRTEACAEQVKLFNNCIKQYNGGPVVRGCIGTLFGCKDQNKEMMACMDKQFNNPDTYFMCKKNYLKDKILYALTKVKKPLRNNIHNEIVNEEINPESQSNADMETKNYYITAKEYYEKTKNINAYEYFLLNQYKGKHPELDI